MSADRGDLRGSIVAGKYRMERLIGRGGMGTVYEARHIELGSRVAIKLIDGSYASSAEVTRRFRREARAASAIESEGIVRVFDIGEDSAVGLFMVMELLSGEDLENRLARERRLDVATTVEIGLQASRALARAHAVGVIHRDLKPANLFLTSRDDGSLRVKIVDFGISKLLDDVVTSAETAAPTTKFGTVLGTPQYMSPEQAQGNQVDARSDVWSLGAVLYEALAGMPLVAASEQYQAVILRILLERHRPLSFVAPHVPWEIAAVIEQAVERDITRRIPDATTFASRLAHAAAVAQSHRISGADAIHPFAATTPAGAAPFQGTPGPPEPTPQAMFTGLSADRPTHAPSSTTVPPLARSHAALAPLAAALAACVFLAAFAVSALSAGRSFVRGRSHSTAPTSNASAAAAAPPPSVSAPPQVSSSPPPSTDAGVVDRSGGRRRAATSSTASSPPARPRSFGGAGVVEHY